MNRTILAGALLAASLSACQLDPAGRCDAVADCGAGQLCLDGVCVVPARAGTPCEEDLECAPWSTCESGACAMLEGRCTDFSDCAYWEVCTADHACVADAGRCQAVWDCPFYREGWVSCDEQHSCTPEPGRCYDDADCASGQRCDAAAHACVTAG